MLHGIIWIENNVLTLAGLAIQNQLHEPPRWDRLFPQGKKLSLLNHYRSCSGVFSPLLGIFHL